MNWAELLPVCVISLAALIGIVLTLLTLPGTWLMILATLGVLIWKPGMFEWYTIVSLILLATIAEAIDILAGAAGARKFGGSRRAAIGATVGTIAGAILLTFVLPIPIVGTLVGAILGAGAGAMIAERFWNSNKDWGAAARIGSGAAAGRLAAVLVKGGVACIMAVVMIAASLIP